MDTTREKYLANEILKIGDIVEDAFTSEKMKIIGRGTNYITLATKDGDIKRWLNEVSPTDIIDEDYRVNESGQFVLFGYTTNNFNLALSEEILQQFEEFDDLYCQHQIIKCLDEAIGANFDRAYELLNRVNGLYHKISIEPPFIVEMMKTQIEKNKVLDMLIAVAGVDKQQTDYKTIEVIIKAFEQKYKDRRQWEALAPFLYLAKSVGLYNATTNLPFSIREESEDIKDKILDFLYGNVDLLEEEAILEIDWDEVIVENNSSALHKKALKLASKIIAGKVDKHLVNKPDEETEDDNNKTSHKKKLLIYKLAEKLLPKINSTRISKTTLTNPQSFTPNETLTVLQQAVVDESTVRPE